MDFQSPYDLFPSIKVRKDKSSLTVPDMSFTPREILSKFSRGERVPLGFEGLYDDENSSPFDENPTRDPDFDQFDYVEEKRALDERMSERAKRSKEKEPGSSKRKASDEELSASDSTKRETTSEDPQGSVPTSS